MHLFKELLCSLSLPSHPFLPSTEETSLKFLLIKTKSVETPVFTGSYVKNKTKKKKENMEALVTGDTALPKAKQKHQTPSSMV